MEKLNGKKVFITGGSRGIGKAIAIALANAGADVLISYNKNEQEAINTISEIHKLGKYADYIKVDLSNRTETQTLIEKVVEKLGYIDVLVNNAGILTRTSFLDVTDNELEKVIDVNLIAPFMLTQEVAKEMIRKKH